MCAAHRSTPGQPPDWIESNQKLSTAWMMRFEECVTRRNSDWLKKIFHPHPTIIGGDRHGPVDDMEAGSFRLDIEKAKILPMDRVYSLVVVEWRAQSPILGGEMRRGNATFVIYVTPAEYDETPEGPKVTRQGSVLCVHAHFSRE